MPDISVEPRSPKDHIVIRSKEQPPLLRSPWRSHQSENEVKDFRPRWKIGARYCASAAGLVFLMNAACLLAGEAHFGFPALGDNQGRRIIYEGNCDTVKRANTVVHFFINAMSTVLLGASNYCMQCMSSPTRAEADRAHARSQWVDIGIPSIRNLFKVRKRRALLWLFLGLSSLPLHLLYVKSRLRVVEINANCL
jgi:hypothetical protein